MYSDLKDYFGRLMADDGQSIQYKQQDARVGLAVLYYRVILVDGRVRYEETERFRQILSDTLEVCEEELILFERKVLDLAREQTSLARLTDGVARMPLEKRRQILRHMQQISVSDRELHEFEINLVARTAELIGLAEEWLAEEEGETLPPKPGTTGSRAWPPGRERLARAVARSGAASISSAV